MKEDFLHFVWRLRRFRQQNLLTTSGETIEIINLGQHNNHAGPDFLNARIRIGGTLWAGSVEMHLRSSQWYAHQHQQDPNYENVILHVVLDEDESVQYTNGERIPCLNLRPYLHPGLARQYLRLLHSEQWIPCQNQLYQVPEIKRQLWLDRLLVERLEQRTAQLAKRLAANQQDWEETFYQSLAWGLGLRVNADAFLMLAEATPLKVLHRHRNNILQLEALLFGQAGLLEDEFQDAYPQQLQQEYRFLRTKFKLDPISTNHWKFMRMRPANFPTVRIAQWATLHHRTGQLFSKMLVARNVKEIENAFVVELSNYWQTHYRFDKESPKNAKTLGKARVHLLIINVIAPFLFFYGKARDEDRYQDRALQLLEEVPAEKNHILREWGMLGLSAGQAAQSQALLYLKQYYCDQRRCLDCAIGCQILNQPSTAQEEAEPYLPIWWLETAAEAKSTESSPAGRVEDSPH
ncbi:MAG: DUF2851 family protein [Bacteroidota bacterium]